VDLVRLQISLVIYHVLEDILYPRQTISIFLRLSVMEIVERQWLFKTTSACEGTQHPRRVPDTPLRMGKREDEERDEAIILGHLQQTRMQRTTRIITIQTQTQTQILENDDNG
jgi:hypothetical protein